MTLNQLIEIYKKRFILVLKTVGDINSNNSFKNAESLIEERSEDINKLINLGADFSVLVVYLMSIILVDMYGVIEVSSWGNITQREECTKLYETYLEEITNKFTRKYGVLTVKLPKVKLTYGMLFD